MFPRAFSVAMRQRIGFRWVRNDVPITETVSYVIY